MSRVAVIGAGYVGLTTAACLAHLGHEVVCADIDAEKVARLTKGEVPILEDGPRGAGRRRPRVGTPALRRRYRRGRHRDRVRLPLRADAAGATTAPRTSSCVEEAAREIAPVLQPGAVVINKSTMPVGSTVRVDRVLREAGAVADVGVASNPEFLREGTAVRDFLHPDRVS